jgi:hypothetical protein
MANWARRLSAVGLVCGVALASCVPQATPTASVRSTPRLNPSPTSTWPLATPEPGHNLALRAYLRAVHSRVLLEYARRSTLNQAMLDGAQSTGMDADMLCSEEGTTKWYHVADLSDEARAIAAPAGCTEFRQALLDALEAAEATAQSHGWLCETYAAFGQPAEGMWAKMIQHVRADLIRAGELRETWRSLGGEEAGLLW